jgi:hypothetical protein
MIYPRPKIKKWIQYVVVCHLLFWYATRRRQLQPLFHSLLFLKIRKLAIQCHVEIDRPETLVDVKARTTVPAVTLSSLASTSSRCLLHAFEYIIHGLLVNFLAPQLDLRLFLFQRQG